MPLLNYTTKVQTVHTVAQIQSLLAHANASRIMLEYGADAQPIGIAFELLTTDQAQQYRLPCRHEAVLHILQADRKVAQRLKTEEQALRVAWRIVKDWLEAQLALIEADMASMDEIMLPYMLTPTGTTVYQQLVSNRYILEDKETPLYEHNSN